MTDQERDPLAAALRASLARQADQAPSGELLAERIIHAAGRTEVAPPPRRRGWRTWALPVIAAGAVGAVVAAVVAVQDYRPSAHRPPAGASTMAPAPASIATPSPRTAAGSSTAPSPSTTAPPPATLHDVRVLDLTFAGADDGWALASANCLHGAGRCTALLRTTDGTSWRGMPGAAFNVDGVNDCADPCVSHLRFATDDVGYAFGPSALFMTTDGGATWHRQPGLGADALETLNGNVVMYGSRRGGASCASGCPVVLRSAIGSTTWTAIDLPGGVELLTAGSVFLARAEHVVVLLASGYNPAKGYEQPATLYRSADDGRTWHRGADPCPSIGAGYSDDAVALTVGADGTLVVACVGRDKAQTVLAGSTVASTDGGRTFTAPAATGKLGPATLIAAADANHQFVYAAASGRPAEPRHALYASAGRNPWNPVADITGVVTFVGFESTSVGRVVADGGRTIWTTRDAGATWSPVTLP